MVFNPDGRTVMCAMQDSLKVSTTDCIILS